MNFESKSTLYMVGWETRWRTTNATISTWVGLNKLWMCLAQTFEHEIHSRVINRTSFGLSHGAGFYS